MKRRMMVLVMIAVLAASSPAMVVACQTEEAATNQEAATTTTTSSSSMGGLETFTTLTAWGDNFLGQLGNGVPLPYPDDSHSTIPVEVSNLEGAELKAIAAGQGHSLALKNDGTVWAWGLNQDGQLGDGTTTDSSTPVQVNDPTDSSGYLTDVSAIAAGSSHSLALKSDGTVWAWGNNFSGELGDGTTTDSSNKPVQVSELDGIEAIAAGGSLSLALKNDGTVWAWGDNQASQGSRIGGQLGDDEITSSNTPLQVSDLPGGIEAIAAGAEHGLALNDDGTVWAWGYNFFGQLGNGTATDSSNKPVQVSELDGVKGIAAGGSFSLALKDDGTVWAWGDNQVGQLGDGTSTDGTPTTCEYTETGGGSGTSTSCTGSNTPVQMSEVSGIEAIAAGVAHGLALKDDGTVWAWGMNQSGLLGDVTYTLSTTTPGINTPVQVGNLSAVKAIAAGVFHSLAGW